MEQIDVVDLNSPVSRIILETISEPYTKRKDFEEKMIPTGRMVNVELTVNGVSVPVVQVLESIYQSIQDQLDNRAKELAFEMVSGSKLMDLMTTIQNAEYAIRDELTKLGFTE